MKLKVEVEKNIFRLSKSVIFHLAGLADGRAWSAGPGAGHVCSGQQLGLVDMSMDVGPKAPGAGYPPLPEG